MIALSNLLSDRRWHLLFGYEAADASRLGFHVGRVVLAGLGEDVPNGHVQARFLNEVPVGGGVQTEPRRHWRFPDVWRFD